MINGSPQLIFGVLHLAGANPMLLYMQCRPKEFFFLIVFQNTHQHYFIQYLQQVVIDFGYVLICYCIHIATHAKLVSSTAHIHHLVAWCKPPLRALQFKMCKSISLTDMFGFYTFQARRPSLLACTTPLNGAVQQSSPVNVYSPSIIPVVQFIPSKKMSIFSIIILYISLEYSKINNK